MEGRRKEGREFDKTGQKKDEKSCLKTSGRLKKKQRVEGKKGFKVGTGGVFGDKILIKSAIVLKTSLNKL